MLTLLSSGLGFPEFENLHLSGFPNKAQFAKSAASTIPPRPHIGIDHHSLQLKTYADLAPVYSTTFRGSVQPISATVIK